MNRSIFTQLQVQYFLFDVSTPVGGLREDVHLMDSPFYLFDFTHLLKHQVPPGSDGVC